MVLLRTVGVTVRMLLVGVAVRLLLLGVLLSTVGVTVLLLWGGSSLMERRADSCRMEGKTNYKLPGTGSMC